MILPTMRRMAVEHRNPERMRSPGGQYSLISIGPPGARIVCVSGQTGRRSDHTISSNRVTEIRDAFEHVGLACTSIGATPYDIIHLRTLLVGRSTMADFHTARSEIFVEWFDGDPPPASTVAFVVGLADPEASCEIEALIAQE